MSRILALGGCGFIGSYVLRRLLEDGHEITSVDNFSKYGYIEHDFYKNSKFRLIKSNVQELSAKDYEGYDYVICLAALIGGIRYFHKIPYRIAKENTNILTSAIDNTIAGSPNAMFYYFSSSMVYERATKSVTEEDVMNQQVPLTNYGAQKLFGEYIVRGAQEELGLNWVIVRPFNAVGAGELPDLDSKGKVEFGMAHVVPDFIYKSITKQNPFEMLGDGDQVRTFTHAKDIAEGIRLMIKKNVKNQDFNLCGNTTYSMKELAEQIWHKVNPNEQMPMIKNLPALKDDVKFRVGISTKAQKFLGWTPKYGVDYIIEDTLNFIKKNIDKL